MEIITRDKIEKGVFGSEMLNIFPRFTEKQAVESADESGFVSTTKYEDRMLFADLLQKWSRSVSLP